MKRPALEFLVRNDFRLDILCCLAQEPMTPGQVSARTAKPVAAVSRQMELLAMAGLIEPLDDQPGGPYGPPREAQPPWVTEAIEEHGQSD